MYGMDNSVKLFADDLTEWLLESGFIQSQCQMSIYYKCAPDGSKQKYYLILVTVCIGIHLRLSENVFCIL